MSELKFARYKQNLTLVTIHGETFVKSYSTLVAKVDHLKQTVHQLGYWSMTTQKHINYAAKQLNYELNKN
jgi:hypothetical protein